MSIKKFENFDSNENDPNLDKLIKMKEKYDKLINGYTSQYDASRELMRDATGGYEIGDGGYPIVYFQGDYCFIIGGGIYKKI